MESEGFTPSDIDAMLEEDGREGYVERLKIMYRAREGLKHRCFPFIPLYYYPHFIMMKPDNTEHLRERLKNAGVFDDRGGVPSGPLPEGAREPVEGLHSEGEGAYQGQDKERGL